MDLFSYQNEGLQLLADRMRPMDIQEYLGQEHILGPGKVLRTAIEQDQLQSIILYGPPGCGKTTLAHIISNHTKSNFVRLNAVEASVKEVREVIEQAKLHKGMYQQKTILFLDEVHRFNTTRQDALLPAVEKGILILIGATTENPFHYVNGALLSRSTLFQLLPLSQSHSLQALQRALKDKERGLGQLDLQVDPEALEHIAAIVKGDIRRALNALEFAALTTAADPSGKVHVTLPIAEECVRIPHIQADESTQYDLLSAFHKSIRGSSDAALLWFFYAVDKLGMDARVFLRRLVAACSEDIGLANPQAMVQAVQAWQAFEKMGWPEAKYPVAQAILFAVESPKSNAISKALRKVSDVIETHGSIEVPLHLRDQHYKGAKELGHQGYLYPHDYKNHYVKQDYLPDYLQGTPLYEPTQQGLEEKIFVNQQNRDK